MVSNDLSVDLALKFAFLGIRKILLSLSRLADYSYFLIALAGSVPLGSLTYVVAIGVLGFANYMKMSYRQEPIYPDDLKMITEIGLLKDMTGTAVYSDLSCRRNRDRIVLLVHVSKPEKEGDSN